MDISVSYLSSIYDKDKTIKMINKSNATSIHSDVMDGKFVTKKNFSAKDVVNDLKNMDKPVDIHLMVENPDEYIDILKEIKPRTIIFHLESKANIESTIAKLKKYKIGVGVAIKPQTDPMYLEKYLDDLDMILVMTVEPGAGGQRFIFDMLDKIEKLDKIRKDKRYIYKIGVDGGINEYTAIKCRDANVDVLVTGSYVCHQEDFNNQIAKLKRWDYHLFLFFLKPNHGIMFKRGMSW